MLSSAITPIYQHLFSCGGGGSLWGRGRTFEELAAVDLAGGDFEGDNMALQREELAVF
jgi:hypothetical protein